MENGFSHPTNKLFGKQPNNLFVGRVSNENYDNKTMNSPWYCPNVFLDFDINSSLAITDCM